MDDIKAITLRRIQAVRAAEEAEKETQKCKDQAKRLREIEHFAPLKTIFDAVADMPAKSYRAHAGEKVRMWQHVWREAAGADCQYSSLSFAGFDGNTRFRLAAEVGDDGACRIRRYTGSHYDPKVVSMDEAEDILLKYISNFLITDDEQAK